MDGVAEVAPPLLCVPVWCVGVKGVSKAPEEILGHL